MSKFFLGANRTVPKNGEFENAKMILLGYDSCSRITTEDTFYYLLFALFLIKMGSNSAFFRLRIEK